MCILTVAARSRLRSADHGDIVVPRAPSTRFGCRLPVCRSFRVCGPKIWNKLAQDLRSTDTRNSLNVGLMAGYLIVRTTEVAPYKLTYLLSSLYTHLSDLNLGSRPASLLKRHGIGRPQVAMQGNCHILFFKFFLLSRYTRSTNRGGCIYP